MLGEALVVEEIPVMGQEDAPLAPCACEHVLVAIAEQSELAAEGGVPPLTAQIFSDLGACAPPLYDYDDYHVHLRRANLMNANLWTVAEAKAKLSRVIEEAQKRGPQTITRRGRRAAVVVDAEEWERRTQRAGTLADFFRASPLQSSGLKVQRSRDRLRPADL